LLIFVIFQFSKIFVGVSHTGIRHSINEKKILGYFDFEAMIALTPIPRALQPESEMFWLGKPLLTEVWILVGFKTTLV